MTSGEEGPFRGPDFTELARIGPEIAQAVVGELDRRRGFESYDRNVVDNATALAKSLESTGMWAVAGGTDTHLALVTQTRSPLRATVASAQ
ncbi:MAG: hypothetical protein WAW17_14225 [Rhodococcus sp. (in: high G+C Gram-positive bacteria)]|uniref:hypothetical protein n=1 Tax=Rhodococcus sp. TaxID=1831 RepID=UPI003BB067C8